MCGVDGTSGGFRGQMKREAYERQPPEDGGLCEVWGGV